MRTGARAGTPFPVEVIDGVQRAKKGHAWFHAKELGENRPREISSIALPNVVSHRRLPEAARPGIDIGPLVELASPILAHLEDEAEDEAGVTRTFDHPFHIKIR